MHAEGLITPALGFYGSKIKEKKGKNHPREAGKQAP